MIYFIRCGDFVKIGVSHTPWRRLLELQTGNPVPLELLAVIDGGEKEEAELHDRFSADHSNLEWFRLSPDIQSLVELHKHAATRHCPPATGPQIRRRQARSKWRIEYNRRKTEEGHIYHWVYRCGGGENRAAIYGGMVQEWMLP